MINQIILAGLDILRRRKVHSVRLAHALDRVIRPRQTQNVLVKVCQVVLRNLGRVPRRVASDEDRPHDSPMRRLDLVNHASHFVQLFGTDVRTVGEAKVDQRVFALEILFGELMSVVVDEFEGSADQGPSYAFAVLCYSFALHTILFVAEIHCYDGAGHEEEDTCLPGERLRDSYQ